MNNTIAIDLIHPNPYQPRSDVDLAVVVELAENIEKNATEDFDGLLQVPTVRRVGDSFELAFGHTRQAAFRYLYEQGKERYGKMRVEVRDLTDLQMFELAVSENMKRRDLNPIEQAEALRRYMDEFGKTSAEAGEFFGISASTIRGSVRLLNLPEAAQAKVRSGEIKISEARALLVVEKLLGEDGVVKVLEAMVEEHEGPIEAIVHVLQYESDGKAQRLDLDAGWVPVNPFPTKHLAALKEKEIKDLLIVEDENELDGKEADVKRLFSFVQSGMVVMDESFPLFPADGLEQVRVLTNLPACMQCPLHAQLDGDHFCALKICAKRKETAWWEEEAEQTAKETGIPLYNKATDGAYEKVNGYQDEIKKLVQAVHEDLRLTVSAAEVWGNHNLEGIGEHVQVVVVGKMAEKLRKKDEKQKVETKSEPKETVDYELARSIQHEVNEFCWKFNWEVGAKNLFAVLDGITNFAVLEVLCNEFNADYPGDLSEHTLIEKAKKAKKADGLREMRRILAMGMIDRNVEGWNSNEKNVITKYAKGLAETAKEWGATLPKDWAAQVERYQTELDAALKGIREARAKEKGK